MQTIARQSWTIAPTAWRARCRAAGVLVAASAVMAMPAAGLTLLMFGRAGLGLAGLWFVLALAAGFVAVRRTEGNAAGVEARCLAWAGNAPAPVPAPLKLARRMNVLPHAHARGERRRPPAVDASGPSAPRGSLRAA